MEAVHADLKLARDVLRSAPVPQAQPRSDGEDVWFLAAGFAGCLEKPISVVACPNQVRRYGMGAVG